MQQLSKEQQAQVERAKENIARIIAPMEFVEGFGDPEIALRKAAQILSHPDILIRDSDQSLPEPHMHPPEGVLIRFIQDMLGANFVKVIKVE